MQIKNIKKRLAGRLFRGAMVTVIACVGASVNAQDFPNKPIRILVPFAAGGAGDIVTRLLADAMSKDLGQAVIVDNRAGADGIVGTEIGAHAPPDGYNLLQVGRSTLVFNKGTYKTLSYDPAADFAMIGLVLKTSMVLMASPASGIENLNELISKAKAKPGGLNYTGTATVYDFAFELFKSRAGLDIVRIPYKGSAPALQDVMAGRVELTLLDPLVSLPHLNAGKLKPLAVTSRERLPLLPNVPTLNESGFPGFELAAWTGIAAPKNTPPEIVAKLNSALTKAVRSPAVSDRIKQFGFQPITSSPAEMQQLVNDELAIWPAKLRELGFKSE